MKALVLVSDPVFVTHRKQIAELALKHRVPVAAGVKEFAEAGLLMSCGMNLPDLYRRTATYVDKILKGVKPAELPIERRVKFEFVVNLNTARKIGVTVPQSVLFRADAVIK